MVSSLHEGVGAAREAVVLTEPATGLIALWASALHASRSLQQAEQLSILQAFDARPSYCDAR